MAVDDTNPDLAVKLESLAKELRELDDRNLELEQLAAQRGVKLSCANIALSRAKIAFEQAAQRREEMVQDVAHDLRTPLTSIKGASQNLLDDMAGRLSESAREYVEIVRDQAEHLIGIERKGQGQQLRRHAAKRLPRAYGFGTPRFLIRRAR